MLISPPCPLFFFRLALNLFWQSLRVETVKHYSLIHQPFLAISPLLLVTWYWRATSDQLISCHPFCFQLLSLAFPCPMSFCRNFQSEFSFAFSLIFLPRLYNSIFFLQPPQIQRIMQAFPIALLQMIVVLPNICANYRKICFFDGFIVIFIEYFLLGMGRRWFSLELHVHQ